MSLRVVGAGVGRTGTTSLKAALERLLGGRCYHMFEVFGRPDDVAVWDLAAKGQRVDWEALFAEFTATVDWPGAACWKEIADAFPDAVVLLSTRSSAEAWWKSAHDTIFGVIASEAAEENAAWRAMVLDLLAHRFTPDWQDHDAAVAAYEKHNAEVRAAVAPERLVEWSPGDGWGPLCTALGVPVPEEPFPHLNTTEEFRGRAAPDSPA